MQSISFFKRYSAILLLVYAIPLQVSSQVQDVSAIPDSLKKDAGMVKQMDETEIEIESPRKAKLHLKYVYTILNSTGDQYATVYTFYDRFHKLKNATAVLYDGNGKEIKKIGKKDMEDWSAEGSSTLLTDTRIKIYHFSHPAYPYTISYEEEADLDGYFILPQWLPQPSGQVAVEDCRLIVRSGPDYPLHYREYHFPTEALITGKNGEKNLEWDIRNRKAVQPEVFSPAWNYLEPCVKLAPGEFEIQGFKGNLNSWADLGIFMNQLWKDRDILPEEAKKKVHELVDGVTDSHRRIELLYDFLQKNSHYVSIQLGIGGWQPFDAAYVYHNRYGDCKALCNFMVALLKEAGISANSVLISAGEEQPLVDTGFACSQFNHVIVLARAGGDSVWLECTSQTISPGYLGSFTDDREGLILENEKSRLVHTPRYGVAENQLNRFLKGRIDSSGKLVAVVRTRYSGLEQDRLQGLIRTETKKKILDLRQRSLDLSNCILSDLSYREMTGAIPALEETMQINAEGFATVSGSRIFIEPAAFLKKVAQLFQNRKNRSNDIALTSSLEESDSLELEIPRGYIPERMIANHHSVNPFGVFSIRSSIEGDRLLIVSRYQQNKGIYPAAEYSRFSQFLDLVFRENHGDIVLVKKP